jgi:hypothetical protein
MGFKIVGRVLEQSKAKPTDRLVLVAIAWHLSENPKHAQFGLAFPSIATLVRETGLSRSSVFRAVKNLQALGELKRVPPTGDRKSNHYAVHLHKDTRNTPAGVPQEDYVGPFVTIPGSHRGTPRVLRRDPDGLPVGPELEEDKKGTITV